MKFKSIPVRSRRRSRNPPPSAVSLPQNEANEACDSESDELNVSCDPHCENGDTDVEIVPDSFEERNVPPKKRHCFETSDTGKGPDSLNLDACIICGMTDELVWPCSGLDCPVAFHRQCVNDDPVNEDAANFYCPYCWFKIQVLRSKALREKAVAAEKALFKFLDIEMNGGGKEEETILKAREKKTGISHGENGDQEHSGDCGYIVRDQHLHAENDVYPSKEGQAQTAKDNDKSRDECVRLNEDVGQSVDRNGQIKDNANQSSDRCVQLGKSINRSRDQLVQLNKVIDKSRDSHVQLEKRLNGPSDKRVEPVNDQQDGISMAEQDVHDNEKATEGEQQVEKNAEKAGEWVQASGSEVRSETEKFQDAEDGDDEEVAKDRPRSGARTEKIVDGSPFVSIQESSSRNESDGAQSNMRRRRRMKLKEFDSDISSTESTSEWNGQDVTEQSNDSLKTSSTRQAASAVGKTKNQKRKSTAAKAAQQKRETSFVKNDKRKRLLWTPEEEEMLRVGVETHSGDINKNIPWRKILEMGAKVFHETRSPTDLKDKWRAINSKR